MKVLAFDTSSKATSVAVVDDNELLGEVTLNTQVNHSVTLMPTIDYLMTQTGLKPEDIDRIAVAQGPGSYTGIRIAVTCAKTLAYTLNCELVGISSLLAIALRQKSNETIVSFMNARRGMVYAGVYKNGKSLYPDQHIALTDLLTKLHREERIIFTGEIDAFKDEISQHFPTARFVKETINRLPSAYELAKLAGEMRPVDNIHDFNPVYLKKVEAEEKWEAANGTSSEGQKLVSQV